MIQNFLTPLLALLPDFSIIFLGSFIARRVDEAAWKALDWLNFHILFPALLFSAASQKPISADVLASVGFSTWLVITFGFMLGFLIRRLGPASYLDFAGVWQTTWRFNTVLSFVAAKAFPGGFETLMATAAGMAVPLANVFAVGALAKGNQLSKIKILREIVLNPFLLASLAGIAVGLSGYSVPEIPKAVVSRLADAALPLMLLSVGAALDWSKIPRIDAFGTSVHMLKLMILPATVYAFSQFIEGNRMTFAVLLVFAALPTAPTAHVLASRYGADRQLVATIFTQSTFIGCLTFPFWTLVALELIRQ